MTDELIALSVEVQRLLDARDERIAALEAKVTRLLHRVESLECPVQPCHDPERAGDDW
jgi:hypothetical protein